MGRNLGKRIGLSVAFVAALSVGLSAYLNHGKFLRTYATLELDRITFIVDDIRTSVENGLDLGLSLGGMPRVQPLLSRAYSMDEDIQAVLVFDPQGKVMISAGKAPLPTEVPPDWAARREANWTIPMGADLTVIGASLSNGIRQSAGGVAVIHSHSLRDRILTRLAVSLSIAALIAAAAAAALAEIGNSLLMRRIGRSVTQFAAVMDGAAPAAGDERASLVAAARDHAAQALTELSPSQSDDEGTKS